MKKLPLTRTALAAASLILVASTGDAQIEPTEGMREVDLRLHALTDATVVTQPGESLEHMTIILREGMILAIGPVDTTAIPPGAKVWNCKGRMIYPGLIDAAVLVDPGEIEQGPGSHWNRHIHPELRASDWEVPSETTASELRTLGFTTAAVYPESGIFRGTGVVASLGDSSHDPTVYVEHGFMGAGFDRGGGYPNSLMGSIAAMRQALSDASWYEQARDVWQQHPELAEPPDRNDALAALEDVINNRQSVLFEVRDEHSVLRAARVIDEFHLDAMILGSGNEFRRLRDIVATKLPLVIPVNYPARPDVSTMSAADRTSLRDLMTWEQAPTNLRRLINAGAQVAITTNDLRRKNNFFNNVRLAIHNGLDKNDALAALTVVPAKMLDISHLVGTIEEGKVANLIVVDGDLFEKDTKILDVWIDGNRYEINEAENVDEYNGAGVLHITRTGAADVTANVKLDTAKKTVTIELPNGKSIKAKGVTFETDRLSFLIDGRVVGTAGWVQLTGTLIDREFTGSGALPDLSRFSFTITPTDEEVDIAEDDQADEESEDNQDRRRTDDDGDERDPITGDWAASVESEQFGVMPVDLTLTLDTGGVVTGTVDSEFFTADITDGTFNSNTGELRATIDGGGMISTLTATVLDNELTGAFSSDSFHAEFNATRESDVAARERRGRSKRGVFDETDIAPDELVYPLGAYGVPEPPQQQNVLLTNATIWTGGPEGIIERGWMLVENGTITAVGSGAIDRNVQAEIIDCQGKHISAGLIDCHSHTGISGGVNEGSQAVTAEVRIADVINPDDINWYRELAGGLTAVNQLHGSANPIGGQNSVVKIKWGTSTRDMPINDAIPGIKFALGENVKRSPNRYPNTRMGVETLIRDSFQRAVDYRKQRQHFLQLSPDEQSQTIPPRRDLELDALVEILEGDRIVHCHSYRQDEILALIRTADEFGFTIGTFQHVLEGYKIAEAIKKHGAGASTFSDWWAYKMEVMDAIPYNGALMNQVGIVVSFNSDSSELARRLNTEAAKAVRYGGMSPKDALQFVTLNPAKQLRIDHRVGSLEPGKDADFVIWSGDPLSTYTRCEQTWIEGARYFSLEQDQEMRAWNNRERQRLIQKILAKEHGDSGGNAEKPKAVDTETREIFSSSANLPF